MSTKNHKIKVAGVRPANHQTTEKDARRIAIKAVDDLLERNSGYIKTNRLEAFALFYERDVYESAKKQCLTCDPLPGENDRNKDPLKLHSYPGPWSGKPYYKITGDEDDTRRPTIGKIHDSGGSGQGAGRDHKTSKAVTKTRPSLYSIRAKSVVSRNASLPMAIDIPGKRFET